MWLSKKLEHKALWFLGIPIAMALVVWGPYWIWNVMNGQAAWWRIPIISGTVFDTPAYLQWLGQTANGLATGGHIRWFVWPIRAIAWIFPDWSIAEWWLILRWLSITAVLLVSGWAVRLWSGFDKGTSRLVAFAFWVSFVPALGMRPGAYSWYLPFGVLALTLPILVVQKIREHKFGSALLYSIISIVASSVYSWFFMVSVVWLATVWGVWVISKSQKVFWGLVAGSALIAGLVTPAVATWLSSSTEGLLLIDLQLKSGLGFTHLPQITNSFIAMLVWIGICVAGSQGSVRNDGQGTERLVLLQWGWFALLLTWLVTPFMGVYLHNDHFRTPVLMFGWMSLAFWWAYVHGRECSLSRGALWALRGLLLVSLFFIAKIVIRPYGFDHDDLNILHFSQWFTAAMACALLLSRGKIAGSRAWAGAVVIGALLIGGIGMASIYQREFAEMPNRLQHVHTIEWIREHIPADADVCSDPVQADFLASFTGRQVYPAGTTLYYREMSTESLRNMGVYTSTYDVRESGTLWYISYINHFGRSMICHQFPLHRRIFKLFGVSDTRIDAIAGCPTDLLTSLDAITERMVSQTAPNPAFRDLCPIVLISPDQQRFWRLPEGYTETRINDRMSVWRIE